jgi:hypothetical protein
MTLEEFYSRNEYLYHLTSRDNLKSILDGGELYSTKEILRRSSLTNAEKQQILSERRPIHTYVNLNGVEVMIRDQRPISTRALSKTLTDNWTVGQFLESLNSRVFFWPNLKRLQIHFDRYKSEEPKIIRVRTQEMIEANANVLKFCRLNSGATRCHPKWKAPPPRGANTFLKVGDVTYSAREVAEVTFEKLCVLPAQVWTSANPNGQWRLVAS